MIVDSSLFAQVSDNINHDMAASTEAVYIILGYPDTDKRQNPLSLNEYFEYIFSLLRTKLGK